MIPMGLLLALFRRRRWIQWLGLAGYKDSGDILICTVLLAVSLDRSLDGGIWLWSQGWSLHIAHQILTAH